MDEETAEALTRTKALYDAGVLTDEEWLAKKNELLRAQPPADEDGGVVEGHVVAVQPQRVHPEPRPPPPLAPEDLYTGPRSDELLSTEDISGEYSAPRCSEGLSMTVVPLGADAIEMWSSGCLLAPIIFLCGPKADGYIWTRKPGTNEFGRVTFSAGGTATILIHTDGEGGTRNEVYKKLPHSQKRTFQKVDARDLAGKWCGCVFSPIVLVWPFSCFTWTAKKALDEDRYEESGLRCGLCPPWSISSETYTRRYYDDGGRSYPTNWFDGDQNLPFFANCCGCHPCLFERHIAYRSSGYAVAPRPFYFTKKIG